MAGRLARSIPRPNLPGPRHVGYEAAYETFLKGVAATALLAPWEVCAGDRRSARNCDTDRHMVRLFVGVMPAEAGDILRGLKGAMA